MNAVLEYANPPVTTNFRWLLAALRSKFPGKEFKGKFFDWGYQFGVAITIYQPDGTRLRNAFRAPTLKTIYKYSQIFPAKYERQHQKALTLLQEAGIGWWVPDEDCLNDEERSAWDKAVQIIHSLPVQVQDRKIILKTKPMYASIYSKNALIERATEFFSNWIKEAIPA